MKLTAILTLSLIFLFSSLSAQISNVRTTSEMDKIVITYDLNGSKKDRYNVSMKINRLRGQSVTPKSLKGDFGDGIKPGRNKTIVWFVYEDVESLEGDINPVITATKTTPTTLRPKSKFYFNIEGGYPFFIENTEQDVLSFKSDPSYGGGLGGKIYLAGSLSLQFGVQYREFTYQANDKVSDSKVYTEIHRRVLAPAMLGIGGGHNKPILQFGGYYGRFIHIPRKLSQSNDWEELVVPNDFLENNQDLPYNIEDYGITGNLGYESSNQVGFGLNFTYSLNNFNNQSFFPETDFRNTWDVNSHSINFYISFLL